MGLASPSGPDVCWGHRRDLGEYRQVQAPRTTRHKQANATPATLNQEETQEAPTRLAQVVSRNQEQRTRGTAVDPITRRYHERTPESAARRRSATLFPGGDFGQRPGTPRTH